MIPRQLYSKADELLTQFPLVAIIGPRQSGKTTFAQQLRPNYRYMNMELQENRGQ